MSCYKKIIVLSKTAGKTPTFIAQKGQGWEYRLNFDGEFDEIALYIGDKVATKTSLIGETAEDLSDLWAVAIVLGDDIISSGGCGKKTDKDKLKSLLFSPYDDEAIATENYYEGVYGQEYENARAQNGRQTRGDGEDTQSRAREDDEGGRSDAPPDQTAARADGYRADGVFTTQKPYVEKVLSRLERLFESNEPYFALKYVIPHSRWVVLEGEKKIYLGVQGAPDYILYATKGNKNDPACGKGAFFVPESYLSSGNEGYFVIIQSAVTGEEILPKF